MAEMRRVEAGKPSGEEVLWAYYQLIPPRPSDRMSTTLALVDQENAEALHTTRNWTGRP